MWGEEGGRERKEQRALDVPLKPRVPLGAKSSISVSFPSSSSSSCSPSSSSQSPFLEKPEQSTWIHTVWGDKFKSQPRQIIYNGTNSRHPHFPFTRHPLSLHPSPLPLPLLHLSTLFFPPPSFLGGGANHGSTRPRTNMRPEARELSIDEVS